MKGLVSSLSHSSIVFYTALLVLIFVGTQSIVDARSCGLGSFEKNGKSSVAEDDPGSFALRSRFFTRGGGKQVLKEGFNGIPNNATNRECESASANPGKVFQLPEEELYDRYAACLAATEGVRNIRSKDIDPKKKSFQWNLSGKKNVASCLKNADETSRIISALGMSVAQFNDLSQEIAGNEELKRKVMEQSYLYRLSSMLPIPQNEMPVVKKTSTSLSPQDYKDSNAVICQIDNRKIGNDRNDNNLRKFALSVRDIERLRLNHRSKLTELLQIPALPESLNLCDPNVMPLLAPGVRAVCEAFPLQADEIVRNYGLTSDEFNSMLEKSKSDFFFRWKVKRVLGQENS